MAVSCREGPHEQIWQHQRGIENRLCLLGWLEGSDCCGELAWVCEGSQGRWEMKPGSRCSGPWTEQNPRLLCSGKQGLRLRPSSWHRRFNCVLGGQLPWGEERGWISASEGGEEGQSGDGLTKRWGAVERTRAGGTRRWRGGLIWSWQAGAWGRRGESLLACILRLVGSDIGEDECENLAALSWRTLAGWRVFVSGAGNKNLKNHLWGRLVREKEGGQTEL